MTYDGPMRRNSIKLIQMLCSMVSNMRLDISHKMSAKKRGDDQLELMAASCHQHGSQES